MKWVITLLTLTSLLATTSVGAPQLTGEPRTVRLIYFLPNDRPFRATVAQKIKAEIRTIQHFYAEQMQAYQHGNKTFRIETDAKGEPMVHRVDGQHAAHNYIGQNGVDVVLNEINPALSIGANTVDFIVIDSEHYDAAGGGGRNGGFAYVDSDFSWQTGAHELGHAFGLEHDFRDGAYIMSYGPGENRLSECSADYLAVHPYFNPDVPTEAGPIPTIELISPPRYNAGASSIPVRLKVSDKEGLHQVQLLGITQEPHGASRLPEVIACRLLAGEREAVVFFNYDGATPSDSLLPQGIKAFYDHRHPRNPNVSTILVYTIDVNGNSASEHFTLFSEALMPVTKLFGDNQTGVPNVPLPSPFVVEVRDVNNGSVHQEAFVTFTITSGGGTLSVERTTTDFNGRASSTLTPGNTLGTNTVTVSAADTTVSFTTVVGTAVTIPDPNLRAIIIDALNKTPSTPIAPADMMTLTELDCAGEEISHLTGLEFATHLIHLDLSENPISSLTPIAQLTHLVSLYLTGNGISDLTPIARFTHLIELGLSRNSIKDLSPIASLTQLKALALDDNSITDLSPIASLTQLEFIILDNNTIEDLSPLVANTGLGDGDVISLINNPLSEPAINTHIPTLQARGITVEFGKQALPLTGDVNGDSVVNILDLVRIAGRFGEEGPLPEDINGDRIVNILDLVLAASEFRNGRDEEIEF